MWLRTWNLQNAGAHAEISSRFVDVFAYDYRLLQPASTPKVRSRYSASTVDLCAGTAAFSGVAGTWYTVTLSANGSSLSAAIGGTPICSGNDPSIAVGGIAHGTSSGRVSFDDVRVTALLRPPNLLSRPERTAYTSRHEDVYGSWVDQQMGYSACAADRGGCLRANWLQQQFGG